MKLATREKTTEKHTGSPGVVTVRADVGTQEGCQASIDAAVTEFGNLHGLFANAGGPQLCSDCSLTKAQHTQHCLLHAHSLL